MTLFEIYNALEVKKVEDESLRKYQRDLIRNETFYLLSPYLTDNSKINEPEDLTLFRFSDEEKKNLDEDIEIPDQETLNKMIKGG